MDIPAGHDLNADQIAYWNGPGGQHWTERQQVQDTLLAPVSDILIDRAKPKAGEQIVDVGCGCGATTIAFATVYPFVSASLDLMVSRFGVMFFAEPAVSFANMQRALRPSGRLTFVCWREPRDNPWLMLPLQAAYHHVPKLPQLGPEDPGPFSFASEQRVRRILGEAGFSGIEMQRCDLSLDVATGRGLDAAVETAVEIGPASRALEGQPPDLRGAAANSIRQALTPFAKGQAVPLPASLWIVAARAS